MIICSDADMDKAIASADVGCFFNNGQVCCASTRIFVHKDLHDEFVARIVKKANARKIGNGWDENSTNGPLVSAEQQSRVLEYIRCGVSEGATLMCGSDASPNKAGFFVEPTVFTNVKDDMKIAREEIFGPVMCVFSFETEEEAVRRANDSPYGLAASVISESFATADRLTRQLKAGTVWINAHNVFDAKLPFGGYKASGIGRELGLEGLHSYLESKTVYINQA